MKILIQGAGLGGCAAAAILSKSHDVTIIEKRKTLATDGVGICLYSNALLSLHHIGGDELTNEVIESGFACAGNTVFIDHTLKYQGTIVYTPVQNDRSTLRFPAYVGIDRSKFQSILFNKAVANGSKFIFGESETVNSTDAAYVTINGVSREFDVVIGADGIRSAVRAKFGNAPMPQYSGFSLWHSMHELHPLVADKMTITMPDRRFGIIPISSDKMYIWASLKTDNMQFIDEDEKAHVFRQQFSGCDGFINEIINSANKNTNLHQTYVHEVNPDFSWAEGKCVLIGDSAHASTPFMAQGAAAAIHDAVSLSYAIDSSVNIDDAFTSYQNKRKPVATLVQTMSKKIGLAYQSPFVNISATQIGLNSFYLNPSLTQY